MRSESKQEVQKFILRLLFFPPVVVFVVPPTREQKEGVTKNEAFGSFALHCRRTRGFCGSGCGPADSS